MFSGSLLAVWFFGDGARAEARDSSRRGLVACRAFANQRLDTAPDNGVGNNHEGSIPFTRSIFFAQKRKIRPGDDAATLKHYHRLSVAT
jgi:hypothetical protein